MILRMNSMKLGVTGRLNSEQMTNYGVSSIFGLIYLQEGLLLQGHDELRTSNSSLMNIILCSGASGIAST